MIKEIPDNHHTFNSFYIFIYKIKMSKKINFFEKAFEVHGEKYDYSLVNYINRNTKVEIICKKHGAFEQRPSDHLIKKTGCPRCSGKGKKRDEVILQLTDKHNGKYDYSKVIFEGVDKKVTIICPEHGEFEQLLYTHQTGSGCKDCVKINLNVRHAKSLIKFKSQSNIVHGNKYDYSNVIYKNGKTKVKIKCSNHGVFEQIPESHLRGRGCPICKNSKGEEKVRNFLMENNIEFKTQFKFSDCRKKKPLPFDFYLLNFNICIEYDGVQHFHTRKGFFGSNTVEKKFMELKESDFIKTRFCEDNNIKLVRIAYNELNWIDKLKTLIYNKN